MKVSMKTAICNVTIALTCDDLLACTCTCKAGAINNKKIVVYIYFLLYFKKDRYYGEV
jgi:hypothetical protein